VSLSEKLDLMIELLARMVELMETPESSEEPDPMGSLDD